MPSELAKRLVKRFNELKSEKDTFNAMYQDISDLVIPTKSNITIRKHLGSRQTERLFDTTALQSNRRFASSLQSTLTNPSLAWFDLVTTERSLMEDEDVRRWLSDTSRRQFEAMQASNMDQQLHEGYLGLTSFGISATLIEEGPINNGNFGGLNFQTYNIAEFWVEEDRFGNVIALHRIKMFDIRDALMEFGEENLPKSMKEQLKREREGLTSEPRKMFPILHSVFPREDVTLPLGPKHKMPFASIHVSVKDVEIIRESGFRRFPYLAPRWSKTPGEKYGRSPAMEALADIQTLNRIVELELRALIKAVNPMIITDDDGALGGSIIVKPGGQAYIRKGSKLEYLENRSRFDIVNLKKVELQDSIRKAFFIDQLLLPPPQNTPMTATEITRRQEQMLTVLGPEMGRLVVEFLRPLIKNVFQIMSAANQFLPMPPIMQDFFQRTGRPLVTVSFKGPLARAQKLSDIIAAERWLQEFVIPASQINPEAVDNFDADKYVRFGGDRLGVPVEVIRNEDEVNEIRINRREAQAQIEEEQRRNAELEAAGKGAPALKLLGEQGGSTGTQAA